MLYHSSCCFFLIFKYSYLFSKKIQKGIAMKKKFLSPLVLINIFLLSFLLVSCGGEDKQNHAGTNGENGSGSYTYDVKYSDNTKIVSTETVDKLISSDKESGVYKFSADADELETLEPGDVVIFAGHSLRKIKNVEQSGDEIIVNTEYATLNEAITDGEISWEKTIDWSESSSNVNTASLIIGDVIYASETKTEFKVHYKGKLQGWDIELELEPDGEKLKIKLTGEKSFNGQKVCKITAEGFLSKFKHKTEMSFSGGQLVNFNESNDGLQGELNVNFAAVGVGSDIAYIGIPAKISIPVLIGGVIPVNLNLIATLKIYPEVQQGASSQGSYKLTYNSDMGFEYENGNTKLNSKLNSQNMDITGETVTAGTVTTGIGVGFEFPRFEVAVLGEIIVPFFLVNISTVNFFEPGILSGVKPCQQGKLNLKVISGVNLKFLGVEYNVQKTHFEKERKWNRGPGCDD